MSIDQAASVRVRGVLYSARPLSTGLVELAVNGRAVATVNVSIRIDGPLLGGDEKSSREIYRGLEAGLCKLLAG